MESTEQGVRTTMNRRQLFDVWHGNSAWLDAEIDFPEDIRHQISTKPTEDLDELSTSKGRPRKTFEESSLKSKKRKVSVIEQQSGEEIMFAAEQSLRSSGKRDAANIVKELSHASPTRATTIKKARKLYGVKPEQMTPEQALAFYVDTKLTSNQYKLIFSNAVEMNSKLYPSYSILREAKKASYPSEENISINDICAEIKLQAILDLTIERLITVQEDVLKQFLNLHDMTFTLICEWGCDGSAGYSQYKQKFNEEGYDDEYLFTISFVPIQLYSEHSGTKQIIWQNPKPSSTKFCRPIKLLFTKETSNLIKKEVKHVEDQIAALRPTKITVESEEITVSHTLLMTMVHGKVRNALANNLSSQKCYICGAIPKQMNQDIAFPTNQNTSTYSFGISSLHAWIRFFECLPHISYRLEIRKWQVRGEKDKQLFQSRKRQIQHNLRNRMGLIVDKPKAGYGSSNDGNTARRFFRNEEGSASITGISQTLIHRFYIILQTLSCGYEININLFKEYLTDTKQLYLSLYSWFYMPATVHKVLIHGPEIISSFMLPIGQLSEDAQEARNKDIKRYREHHARKKSRRDTNTDMLRMLLITSDPVISHLRKVIHKKGDSLSQDALSLLLTPQAPHQIEDDENTSDSD